MWSSIVLSFKSQGLRRPFSPLGTARIASGGMLMPSPTVSSLDDALRTCDKRVRFSAGYSVRERNSIRPVRVQIRVRFKVPERVCHFGRKTVLRDLMEGELVTLSIQGADDFIEAHEIPDQWQVLAVAGMIRERKCSGDDVAEFANITHVNATDARIERNCPAH